MADSKNASGDDFSSTKRSKVKYSEILFDLWSSSDDETSDVGSHVLVADTSRSARFSKAKSSSDNQLRSEPSLDTGGTVHQRPNRGQEKIARTHHVLPKNSQSKVQGKPKAVTLEKHKSTITTDSLTSLSASARAHRAVPLTNASRTRLKTTPLGSSDDSTEEDGDIINFGRTTINHDSNLRNDTGRQPKPIQSNVEHGKLWSSSSSESSSSDVEPVASSVKNGDSCSRATTGWQLRTEQASCKYDTKVILESSSGTCSSSSFDSDSLPSPTKSKRTRPPKSSTTTVPGKSTESSTLLRQVSSRCKLGPSQNVNQVPRFKRAKVSSTFASVISDSSSSSSSDSESETCRIPDLSSSKNRKRTAEAIQRSQGGNKALGAGNVASESSSSTSSDTESEAKTNPGLSYFNKGKRTAEIIKRSRGGNKALGNSQKNQSQQQIKSVATGLRDGKSCSGATVGLQPRRAHTSSHVILGSSSSSSGSSDSDSLLSPTKPKQTQAPRNSTTTVSGKSNDSSNLLQQEYSRCKRGLSKNGNQVSRFKRAKLSSTVNTVTSESSSSSSSDSESETCRNPDRSFFKTQKRMAETIQRSRGGNKALENNQQNPSPDEVTRRKMISLFGGTTSEEGQDTTEEDVKELEDEQDRIKEIPTGEASVSSTRPQTSMSNLTALSSSDNKPGETFPQATTPKKTNSFSAKDNSVILVDITQSTERGAMAGQSRPQTKTNPFTKQGFGESQSTEGMSSVFFRHSHTQKEPPVKRSDGRDTILKATRDRYPKAPTSFHLGHVPEDTVAYPGSQLSVFGPYPSGSKWLTEKSKANSSSASYKQQGSSRESSAVKSSNSQGQASSADLRDEFRFPSTCFEEKHLYWLADTRDSSHSGNEATAASDPAGSSITIFRSNFFVKSPRRDTCQSFQSSNASNTMDLPMGEDCSQEAEQVQSSSLDGGHSKSPVFVRSPSGGSRKKHLAHESRGECSHSFDSRNTTYLSLDEDQRRPVQMRGAAGVTLSSSSSGLALNSRKGDHPKVGKNKRSHHDAKSKTSKVSKHHRSGDRSHSSTAADSQVHNPQTVEVESRQPRQPININSQPTVGGSFTDPHSDVQVLESRNTRQNPVRRPTRSRRKSKHGASISGSQDTRQQISSRGTRDPSQPDVQVLGSRESGLGVGEASARRKNRGAEVSTGRDSIDMHIAEILQQLDEDERMAKQLQEHFDAELARLTEEHSRIMSSRSEILEPIVIPEFPDLSELLGPPRPHLPLPFSRTQPAPAPAPAPAPPPLMPAHGTIGRREMTWRNDLVDMNPMNAAMMAEMGHFNDPMEGQAAYGYRGRVRRGRARGRGRSRTRGHHHNPVQSDGNDYEQLWNLVERVGEAVSKGLPESSINLLPTFLYTVPGQDTTENECSICMGDYEVGESMRRLPCFHFYHAACIDKWLKDNRICPVCREEVNFEAANFTP